MTERLSLSLAGLIAAAGLLLATLPAAADAIDGDWCHTDGRRFSIRGPAIVTPAGTHLEGNYSRHFFSYPVPAKEPGSGQTIFMTLWSENIVHLRLGEGSSGAPEIWNRCSPTTS